MRRFQSDAAFIRGTLLYVFLFLVIGASAAVIFLPQFERQAPVVSIVPDRGFLGLRPFEIHARDRGAGLRQISVAIIQGGTTTAVYEESFPSPAAERKIAVRLEPAKHGLKEGPAELRVAAVDGSYWRFLRGNRSVLDRRISLDFTPPRLEVLSREHYVNFGGAGLVIYRTSKDAARSGLRVENYFFPGTGGYFRDPAVHLAFFVHPYDVSRDARAVVVAEDAAGNQSEGGFFYRVRNVRYKESTISIEDEFIESRVAPLLRGRASAGPDPKETFLEVNRNLREANEAQIRRFSETSARRILWDGAFHQLTNSKVESNFADARTYVYKGEAIDRQHHLGYDLAVTARYPIEAANGGIVVFAGDLGIYGNTVVIDHGYGVQTLYAHMSSIDAKAGDRVKKGEIIGRSGETGLAVGDHLHYGVYIHGVAAWPREWWDGNWIANNILNKLHEAESRFGKALEADSPAATPRSSIAAPPSGR